MAKVGKNPTSVNHKNIQSLYCKRFDVEGHWRSSEVVFVSLTFGAFSPTRRAVDEEAIYRAFGKAISDRRNAIQKTQDRVAKEVGLSRASLANIERGKQRVFLHQVLALSNALELSSSHEIVPTRVVALDPESKAEVTVSGAKNLSKSQKAIANSIVMALTAHARGASK